MTVRKKRVMEGTRRSGGAGPFERSDSRQSGSETAEAWLRLQPERPQYTQYTQYTQYNVLLCYRRELLLQPGPLLPGGPQSGQKHTPKNNTLPQRDTVSVGETAAVERGVASPKPGGRKTVSQRAQVLFLYILSFFLLAPSVLFIHKHSQMAAALWCKCWSITRLPLRQETGLPGTWVRSQTVLQL